MDIQKIKSNLLNPAKYNPRRDLKPGDKEYEKLKRSIETYGYVEPVVWNKRTENVVSGHQRLKVLLELGYTEIDCVVIDMDEQSEKALNVAMNKIGGEFDIPLLTDLLKDIGGSGFDVSLTGFDAAEIDDLFNNEATGDVKEDDFDLSAALEKAAFVLPGDVWTLSGKHRLMCGDSTKPDDVALLMDGKKANMCVTDIPFGVNYKSSSGLSIANDNLKDEQFYQFLLAAFSNIASSLDNEGTVYVFHADSRGLVTRRAFDDAGLKCAGTCVWVKNSQVLGHADYMYKHESILYGWKKDCRHKFYGDRKQTTVWNFDKPKKNESHPNAKPIELIALPIKNSSQTNGIILDLFGGGGATLIASEQLGRLCYMSELDPKYASVILRRFAENFGSDNIVCKRANETLKYSDLVRTVESK